MMSALGIFSEAIFKRVDLNIGNDFIGIIFNLFLLCGRVFTIKKEKFTMRSEVEEEESCNRKFTRLCGLEKVFATTPKIPMTFYSMLIRMWHVLRSWMLFKGHLSASSLKSTAKLFPPPTSLASVFDKTFILNSLWLSREEVFVMKISSFDKENLFVYTKIFFHKDEEKKNYRNL